MTTSAMDTSSARDLVEEADLVKLESIRERIKPLMVLCNESLPPQTDATPITRFQGPADPQTTSTLLQLPIEIQLRIYCFLLKRGSPISTYKAHYADHKSQSPGDDPPLHELKSAWLSLSSQLLRCCQMIYRLASPILYEENTLTIDVFRWFDMGMMLYLTILDEYMIFPGEPWLPPRGDLESLLTVDSQPMWLLWAVSDTTAMRPLTGTTCNTLGRFKNILVSIHSMAAAPGSISYNDRTMNMDILCLIYVLRDHVADKNISVSFYFPPPGTYELQYQLRAFEVWRCASITFRNLCAGNIVMTDSDTKETQLVITKGISMNGKPDYMIEVYDVLVSLIYYERRKNGTHRLPESETRWQDVQTVLQGLDGGAFENVAQKMLGWMSCRANVHEKALYSRVSEMIGAALCTCQRRCAHVQLVGR